MAMRQVMFPGLEGETSCLGMGCASLGSRIGPKQGMRALESAYERGVRWFDVAPAYGAGRAEDLLGTFLKTHGAPARICTKVGLAPPPMSAFKSAAMAVVRRAAPVLGPLKARLRSTKLMANRHIDLTPELVARSVDTSLRRLGRDQVDVYALHEVNPDDLDKDEIIQALEGILQSGKAKLISVAGDYAAARKALETGAPYGAVQIGLSLGPESGEIITQARARGLGTVVHSVFGVSGSLQDLTKAIAGRPEVKARLEECGVSGKPQRQAAHLLLARALALNSHGITLTSMYSESRIDFNTALGARPIDPDSIRLLDEIFSGPV